MVQNANSWFITALKFSTNPMIGACKLIDENNKQADQCQNKPIATTINFTATIPDLK